MPYQIADGNKIRQPPNRIKLFVTDDIDQFRFDKTRSKRAACVCVCVCVLANARNRFAAICKYFR